MLFGDEILVGGGFAVRFQRSTGKRSGDNHDEDPLDSGDAAQPNPPTVWHSYLTWPCTGWREVHALQERSGRIRVNT